MRQRRPFLTFTLALLFCLSLAACGAKQYPMEITVVNRTTYPIADIRISLTSEEDWGENRLETTLAEGESTEIDLGEYTEGQLNEGFSLQFYGEDGEPVNPDYDPSSPMFFDNGDFLIFAPPDLSVALFLDTAYDKEVYDQKIVESYAADGDGRGDVISRDDIPVLMGGALPFTNMQNLLSENHDDGTYRYEDITEDGQLLVVNTAEQSCFVPDVQELDDYLTACALSLSDAGMKVVWIEESVVERWEHQEDGSDRPRRETYYLPTYEYTVNGTTYRYSSHQSLSGKRDLGRQVVGYYDPAKPECITENRPRKPVFGGAYCFLWAAFLLFFGIMTFTGQVSFS